MSYFCEQCKGVDVRVTDSRRLKYAIKRRRACNKCNHRWTTYEVEADAYERSLRLDRYFRALGDDVKRLAGQF